MHIAEGTPGATTGQDLDLSGWQSRGLIPLRVTRSARVEGRDAEFFDTFEIELQLEVRRSAPKLMYITPLGDSSTNRVYIQAGEGSKAVKVESNILQVLPLLPEGLEDYEALPMHVMIKRRKWTWSVESKYELLLGPLQLRRKSDASVLERRLAPRRRRAAALKLGPRRATARPLSVLRAV